MSPLLDDGLQPERTWLAWRRTYVAVVTGGVVGLRVLPELAGSAGLVVAVAVVVAGGVLAVLAEQRSRRVAAGLRGLPGAGLLVMLAAVVSSVAGVAVVGVLVGASG